MTTLRRKLAVALGAAALAAPLLTLGGPPADAQASTSQTMTFEAPAELLDDARRDRTLDEIAAFGVRSVRVLVYWRSFAPEPDSRTAPQFDASDPNSYPAGTWDRLDRLVTAARARGIDPFLTLTGPVPKWATKSKRDNLTEPDAKAFGRWVTAVGRRYGSFVRTWSIWNEPNQPQFLKPQYRNRRPASPRIYRKLYQAAAKALRATPDNSRDTILLGETSPEGNANVVTPLAFLRGTLCLSKSYKRSRSCGKLDADGYAHHAYTKAHGPFFKHSNKENVNIGALSRLTKALASARRAKAVDRLPLYLTEFGIQSYPDKIAGVSASRQAEYIALSEWIAYRNSSVKAFSQYLMQDDQPRPGSSLQRYSGFESGLRYADGRAKPAYDAFRTPLVGIRSGSRVELWGRVRPEPRSGVKVVLQYRNGSSSWRTLKTLTTGSRGVFSTRTSYRSSRRYRVQWTAPSGGTFTGPPVRAYKRG